ncbi:MAG: patatin-like phospholipase family protein [Candidatus Omnitrophica bacterium]|nr:patatin-like phospholipase family protein [Candidatus Omnitrophota bacterium]
MIEPFDQDAFVREIPIFSKLTDDEFALCKQKSSFQECSKGHIIYQEGASADAFYCVVIGRVVIYTQDAAGRKTILEYLHRGTYFGIISLLTGESHSVTAEAVNDCLLLVIAKDDFNALLTHIPSLAIDLSQSLSRRLKRKDLHQKTIFESTIIAVFSSYSQAGKSVYALNLSLSLARESNKSLIVLDINRKDRTHHFPRYANKSSDYRILHLSDPLDATRIKNDYVFKTGLGIDGLCLSYEENQALCVRNLVEILSLLVNDYHYIVFDLPSVMDRSILEMLNQAELIHILTSPQAVDLERTNKLVEHLKTEFAFQESKIRVIINEYKFSKLRHESQMALLQREVYATLPRIGFGKPDNLVLLEPAAEYSQAIRRIARQVGNCQVGLALGAGAAYGFCHIGVLRVLEEERIPVDVVAGSSIGAVIGALWAVGNTSKEILGICSEFKGPHFIWNILDLTLPTLGFIKGKKLYNFLKRHLGSKTFRDVRMPLKIIASDVTHKETKIIDKGFLVDAIMASCSMPGVFMPFKLREEILFDGGVMHPVPTEPLLAMGVKKIIAVNVTPSQEDKLRQCERIKEVMNEGSKESRKLRWLKLQNYVRNKFKANILDYIFSSFEILQSEVAKHETRLADVVLHPDTQGLFWLELHRAEEFAKRGEEETRRNIDKIKQLINE